MNRIGCSLFKKKKKTVFAGKQFSDKFLDLRYYLLYMYEYLIPDTLSPPVVILNNITLDFPITLFMT